MGRKKHFVFVSILLQRDWEELNKEKIKLRKESRKKKKGEEDKLSFSSIKGVCIQLFSFSTRLVFMSK